MKAIRTIGIIFGILGGAFLVTVLLPWSNNSDNALDIGIHDTYIVIGTGHFMFLPVLFCGIMAAVYLLMKRLGPLLGKLHFAASMLLMTGYCLPFIGLWATTFDGSKRRYYSYSTVDESMFTSPVIDLLGISSVLIAIGLLGQLLLPINIIRSRMAGPFHE